MGNLWFNLRYIPTADGKINAAAIGRFMGEIGLIQKIHYTTELWCGGINTSFEEVLEHSGGVLLEIYPDNPFCFAEGVLGGYERVERFLKTNKKEIKNEIKDILNPIENDN